MAEAKTTMVTLETTDREKNLKRDFEISIANSLLSLKKPCWKLSDKKFKWNGTEIVKSPKTPE